MRPPSLKLRRGRRAVIDRNTAETQIKLTLAIDRWESFQVRDQCTEIVVREMLVLLRGHDEQPPLIGPNPVPNGANPILI